LVFILNINFKIINNEQHSKIKMSMINRDPLSKVSLQTIEQQIPSSRFKMKIENEDNQINLN